MYVAFANHGFNPPYHGWILAYNAIDAPPGLGVQHHPERDGAAGVWMGGGGHRGRRRRQPVLLDRQRHVRPNSTAAATTATRSCKLTTHRRPVSDYFTPFNYQALDSGDVDLASGGVMLLPDQPGPHPHEVVAAGKDGTIYLVDRDNMGHVGTNSNNQIVQSLVNVFPTGGSFDTGNYSAPAYFNGTVYFAPVNGPVMAFTLTNGLLSTSPTSESVGDLQRHDQHVRGARGETAISANGNGNGILWALQSNGDSLPGTLHAYDPANLGPTSTGTAIRPARATSSIRG